jgi:hypothetical protein
MDYPAGCLIGLGTVVALLMPVRAQLVTAQPRQRVHHRFQASGLDAAKLLRKRLRRSA